MTAPDIAEVVRIEPDGIYVDGRPFPWAVSRDDISVEPTFPGGPAIVRLALYVTDRVDVIANAIAAPEVDEEVEE